MKLEKEDDESKGEGESGKKYITRNVTYNLIGSIAY